MKESKRTTIVITPEQDAYLLQIARYYRINRSALIRIIIDDYCRKIASTPKEELPHDLFTH